MKTTRQKIFIFSFSLIMIDKHFMFHLQYFIERLEEEEDENRRKRSMEFQHQPTVVVVVD